MANPKLDTKYEVLMWGVVMVLTLGSIAIVLGIFTVSLSMVFGITVRWGLCYAGCGIILGLWASRKKLKAIYEGDET